MGAVYEAEHVLMQKRVALKVLHRAMSAEPEVVARFEREAIAAGRLKHPGVVGATDFGRLADGSVYLALEYVDGRSLASEIEEAGTFSPERALSIAFQVAEVLKSAHAEGIVHRDIKPDNVMLVRTSELEDFVKVLDFGIAKMHMDEEEGERITQAGLVFGTPQYMSPEQAQGQEADARSDIYAVGILLFEMLEGRPPFLADELMMLLAAQIAEPAPKLDVEIPESMRLLVGRLLEKDPQRRPQSAAELSNELRSLAQDLHLMLPPLKLGTGSWSDSRKDGRSGVAGERSEFVTGATLGSQRQFSKRVLRVGSRTVALWIPLVALGLGVLAGGFMVLFGYGSGGLGALFLGDQTEVEQRLLGRARSGDRQSIAELRKRTHQESDPGDEGGAYDALQANRFLALGRGYSVIRHHQAAVEMYREAVHLNPLLAQDPELLVDVRVAIVARDAVDDGLELAFSKLGAPGADIIFDVYLDHLGQAGKTAVVARAMKLVKNPQLEEHATSELRVALRLENAQTCEDLRLAVRDASSHADARSLTRLQALSAGRDCGVSDLDDCGVCLTGFTVALKKALKRAETHLAPDFVYQEDSEMEVF